MTNQNIRRVILTAVLSSGFATFASAQAFRTWVSGVGDDANPCSLSAPCKTWAGAISKTAPGGEIDALNPGGFGAVTINKSITLDGGGGQSASILVSGTNGIIVAAASTDIVVLRNIQFQGVLGNGSNSNAGLNGIRVLSGKSVTVDHCSITGFAQNAIDLESSTANSRALVRDCYMTNNGGGVLVKGVGVPNAATLLSCVLDANINFAVKVDGSGNAVGLFSSFLTGSPAGIVTLNGGQVVSFGANNLISGTGGPTATLPLR
jgi:hypothetical protein